MPCFLQVVLVHEEGRRALDAAHSRRADEDLHPRQVLEDPRVLHGFCRVLAPGEGPVVPHQHGGDLLRREALLPEGLDDHEAGHPLVVLRHLLPRERARDRHVPAEVVGVGGAEAAHREPGLGERGRALGVGVDDAAAGREGPVELEVGGRVGGGPQVGIHDLAGRERHGHDVLRLQIVVGDAAGLDGHEPRRAVDARHVPERPHHEAAPRELPVGAVDLLPERLGHPAHGIPPNATSRARGSRAAAS